MDTQHAKYPGHELTIQQLLHALNEELSAQTASGQLTSDLGGVCLRSTRSVLTQASYCLFSSTEWN